MGKGWASRSGDDEESINETTNMEKLTDRGRLLRTLSYEPVDRAVYGINASPWPETIERWKREGLGADTELSSWLCEHYPVRLLERYGV